jgi:hypothetical protein
MRHAVRERAQRGLRGGEGGEGRARAQGRGGTREEDRPAPRGSMRRAASRPTRNPPKQHSRQVSSKKASLISRSGRMRLLPAL